MERKLRIAVATNFFPSSSQPHRGLPMYNQTRALSKLADVRVFCLDPTYPQYRLLRPRTFLYREVESAHSVQGVQVEYLNYPALPVITRPFNGYRCGQALLKSLDRFRPDVVIGYYLYPEGFGALTAARALNIPVIVGALGSDVRRISNYVIKRLVGETIRKASFAVAVSDELRRRVIGFGIPPEKCRTIHNGCDFGIFRPLDRMQARAELKVPADDQLVLFTGRFVPLKGLNDLLQAIATLVPSRPNLRLCCIGEGPMDQDLRQRASESDLKGHVLFTGPTPPLQVARWLAASDVFCLPSHSEGCPNVIIEALSCGRPVVATDVGGIPELISPRCGILVPPQNPAQLVQGLSKALDKSWDQEKIAASYQRSWDDMARETYKVACLVARKSGMAAN